MVEFVKHIPEISTPGSDCGCQGTHSIRGAEAEGPYICKMRSHYS